MEMIKSHYEILSNINLIKSLKLMELAGRNCYKSENKIKPKSDIKFIKKIINKNHLSILEHSLLTVRFVVNRGVSHELVRHRIASFAQESTRYCNYEKKGIKMIDSSAQFKNPESNAIWTNLLLSAEQAYNDLIANGESPQIARNVLPISLKTEIIVSANFREWREILKQRTAPSAHPEIREIMINLLNELNEIIPVIFEDIEIKE